MASLPDLVLDILPPAERLPDGSLNMARFQRPVVDLPYEVLGDIGAKMAALDAAMTDILDADGGSVHLMLQIMGQAVGRQLTGRTLTVHELLAAYGSVPNITEKFEFIVARNVARLIGVETLNYRSLTRPAGWVITLIQEIYKFTSLPGLPIDYAARARQHTDVFKPIPDKGVDLIAVFYDDKIKRITCGLYQVKDVADIKKGAITKIYDKLQQARAEIEAALSLCQPYLRNRAEAGDIHFGYALIASGKINMDEVRACPGLNYTDADNFMGNTFTAAEAAIYKKVRGPKVE